MILYLHDSVGKLVAQVFPRSDECQTHISHLVLQGACKSESLQHVWYNICLLWNRLSGMDAYRSSPQIPANDLEDEPLNVLCYNLQQRLLAMLHDPSADELAIMIRYADDIYACLHAAYIHRRTVIKLQQFESYKYQGESFLHFVERLKNWKQASLRKKPLSMQQNS